MDSEIPEAIKASLTLNAEIARCHCCKQIFVMIGGVPYVRYEGTCEPTEFLIISEEK